MSQLTLWLRAGSDGLRLSGDPLSHHLFMLLLLKEQADDSLKFEVRTVNEAKPSPEFRAAGLRKAPAIEHDEEVYTHEDDIVDYLEKWTPRRQCDPDAEAATSDLFRHFAFFIKDVNKDSKALTSELYRIDKYLLENETRFLCKDEITFLDTLILPRIHSVRIAGKALKDYEIPSDLTNLWRYVKNGYETELFRKSCPSDQEIILYWADRPDTPDISSQKRAQLYRQKSSHTLNIPDDVTL